MMLRSNKVRGTVWDLDTGRRVPGWIWLETERNQLEAYQLNEWGRVRCSSDGARLTYFAQGRFRFEPVAPPTFGRFSMGAEHCSRCHSPLTLPGDDLCPRCNAADKGVKALCGTLLRTPLLDCRCEGKTTAGYRCSRLAVWQVGDEVNTTPQRKGRILFERAMTVRQRFYCSSCYKAPQLLDAKGEVVEEFSDAGGVRPC